MGGVEGRVKERDKEEREKGKRGRIKVAERAGKT